MTSNLIEAILHQIDRCKGLIDGYNSFPRNIGAYWLKPIEKVVKKAEVSVENGRDLMGVYDELKTLK